MNEDFIKAQDVVVGTRLAGGVVARIEKFVCGDGEVGYRFFAENGTLFWNRHNEELLVEGGAA